ncbi:MAG: hypothetical protein Kow00105_03540 [Phycisphaeraceae bacterium]
MWRKLTQVVSVLGLVLSLVASVTAHEQLPLDSPRPAVDIAILLDTSNSMDGLIDQARGQLWTIVNEFAAAKKHGLTPHLRVALFEYGNTNLPASEGYIRQVAPLTDDLDEVSEALFALTTRGGDEYCGQVIDEAVTRLDWSREPNAYRAIFIAGNEPFTQGPVNYQRACAYAIQHGIIVNTIHCGDYQTGVDGMWAHGAQLGEGRYLNINHDQAVVHIDAPQDPELIRLNAELNTTYIWYGRKGRVAGLRQSAQDENAALFGGANVAQRAASKASGVYQLADADLVDALSLGEVDLQTLPEDDLPEALRGMTEDERRAYIESQAHQRARIRANINALASEREAFVAAERVKLANQTGDTLGDVIVTAVQEQLKEAGFSIADEKQQP